MVASSKSTRCRLCKKDSDLQISHVIPAFVFRWQKKTGGHLRNSKNPNKRVQDGAKTKLLCRECEALINSFEAPFHRNIFDKYAESYILPLEYGPWLSKFCASVSWRILALYEKENRLKDLDYFLPEIEGCLDHLGKYLLSQSPNPGIFSQRIIAFSPIKSFHGIEMPTNINRYFLRYSQIDLPHNKTGLMTYAKIGPFALFGYVKPPKFEWNTGKIKINSGFIGENHMRYPAEILNYLIHNAKSLEAYHLSISETQKGVIEKEVTSRLDQFANSHQFQTMLLDAELFGDEAVTYR
jgi:hypothetical protein